MQPNLRTVFHHPGPLPIRCRPFRASSEGARPVEDVSLRFTSEDMLPLGSFVEITIWASGEAQSFLTRVSSCERDEVGYETHVTFLTREDAYRARMTEQICQIETYRSKVQREEGRTLPIEHAAEEWIHNFAEDFPSF